VFYGLCHEQQFRGAILNVSEGGAYVRRGGRLCHGTMAQWAVQIWHNYDAVNGNNDARLTWSQQFLFCRQ